MLKSCIAKLNNKFYFSFPGYFYFAPVFFAMHNFRWQYKHEPATLRV